MRVPRGILSVRVRFGDCTYTIRFMPAKHMGKDWGRCYPRRGKRGVIEIRKSLSEKNMMDTLIHECLHAANWCADEEFVDATACSIQKALYACGWRRATTKEKR